MIIALATPRVATTIDEGLEKIKQFLSEAAAQQAEIVCFPEAWLPGLRGQDFAVLPFDRTQQERVLQAVSQWARTYAVATILGMERLTDAGQQILNMRFSKAIQLTIFAVLVLAVSIQAQTTTNRFEKNVQLYEAADKTAPPPKNAILLVGDSQFFRWKTLAEDLPDYTIINRGIDSFQFLDILHFYDRLVTPYKPRMIVLHVGGNDVHNGKTAARVLEDFKTFVAKVRAAQPKIPIAFSSLTPGPGRWDEAEKRKQTNNLLKDYIATQKNLHFIDLWDAMLTKEGQPREELWVADRIHPNHDGYLVRVKIMRPLLGKSDKKPK